MADNPAIVVAGAGAIGCFTGGLLAAGGHDISLLARARIIGEIRAHDLTLTDFSGMARRVAAQDITLTADPACLARADIVLVTVKSQDTAAMARAIAAHAPQKACIVSLQNGTGNTDALVSALPAYDVRGGMVPFNVVPMGEGCFHRATSGDIVIAAGPGDVAASLCVRGLTVKDTPDIAAVQWGKFLINLNNALNALSGLPLRQQLQSRDWRLLMADQWAEALRVLRASGIRPVPITPLPVALVTVLLRLPTPLFTRIAATMLSMDSQARTSMAHDLMTHRKTEIDALQGQIVRMGRRAGVATPVSAMVLEVMQAAELAAQGLPDLPVRALRDALSDARFTDRA